MRDDVVVAGAVIVGLLLLDRRQDRGGRVNPLRKPWRGKSEDAGTAAWRAPWGGKGAAEGERRDDAGPGTPR